MLQSGQIIKNLIPTEPVKIVSVKQLGSRYAVDYAGINTNRTGNKVITQETADLLELVSTDGAFNFTGNPTKFLLYAEAERIYSAYQFDPLFAVNCSIVDPLPHQVEAVYKYLLPLPKIRFLLADDTGAGKTIMTGLLLKELLIRGFVERILVITPGGLTKQWAEDEMGVKFNLPFVLVDRARFNSDPNVFHSTNKVVASIDFIRNEDVLNVLKQSRWDIVVVDEAHKLSAFDYGAKQYVSKRYGAVQELSKLCEHLLLLTATPHRGRKDTFKNLLQLLDTDIFATTDLVTDRIRQYEKNGINRFFIRRLKENMQDWHGNALFKARYTRTAKYELTPEEKKLYDAVTKYLTEKRELAKEQKNIHVELTLMVMQRRLTSSIAAITNTLRNRYKALKALLDELNKNPQLFRRAASFADAGVEGFDQADDYDELDDTERESLESILSDPDKVKLFKLFTTAKDPREIKEEADQVKVLLEMAESLSSHEEQKFTRLIELMRSEGVLDHKEKLVIFTEHKDTLNYLERKLSQNHGYEVATIHGAKNVDERREAQFGFAKKDGAQILIATDAAGEGINLQFCRLLINWDIPWNPNRLEQRMGRIHRYGQKSDVFVFNLVALNTREGQVLQRLLSKLDNIREQMGDDRVYDVISEVFEGVRMEDILRSTLYGTATRYDEVIDNELTKSKVEEKINEQKNRLEHSSVNYQDAKKLKESSDEKRLQPIYIRLFFEKTFKELGGEFSEIRKSIYRIDKLPELVASHLKKKYNFTADISKLLFCFDKQVFFDYQNIPDLGKVHYINPGNIIFDALVQVARENYKEEMLKGTILVSPEDSTEYFAFFVKTQVADERIHKDTESIADERMALVYTNHDKFCLTSPAKFIDLKPPHEYAKPVTTPAPIDNEAVVNWAFENITLPQLAETQERVNLDTETREEYIKSAFTNLIFDLTDEINSLQNKMLYGDKKANELITIKQQQIEKLIKRREERIEELQQMKNLSPKSPEVLGCAYVVPLTSVEYHSHYGMSRDDEVEAIAMRVAMEFERQDGWNPLDVSANDEGYDIKSTSKDLLKRYIEVKGRSADGAVMISENEMNRLSQLGECAWLYVVIHCKSKPELFRVPNPGKNSPMPEN